MVNPDPKAVGNRVIALREALNLRHGEFATLTGIDKSTLTKVEKGERLLRITAGLEIAAKFSVTLDYLYLGDLSALPPALASDILRHMRGRRSG